MAERAPIRRSRDAAISKRTMRQNKPTEEPMYIGLERQVGEVAIPMQRERRNMV
jgi:hypothetical protein